jgi:hypothetical protein
MFFRGLSLVQSLKAAIMPFVQAPAFNDRNPQAIQRVEHDAERLDGALQH